MILINDSTLLIVWQNKNSVFKLCPSSSPPNIKCPVFWFLKNGIPVLFAYIEGVSVFDDLFPLF